MNEMNRPSRETLIRYFKGECLPHESELIALYLSMDTDKEYVESCIQEVWDTLGERTKSDTSDEYLERFQEQLDHKRRTLRQLPPLNHPRWYQSSLLRFPSWMKAVAAVVLLIGGAIWAVYNAQLSPSGAQLVQEENRILTGSGKATLTLADGSTISLAEVEDGEIAAQEGLRVEKTADGEIIYRLDDNIITTANAYNSVVTPNGSEYRISLPDGSKARLNAASSLTYPVHFSDEERRVKMTGEVYFEIAKAESLRNKKHIPFIVETDKQEVHVLGTHFNVNAYTDEPAIRTTLVEGSVRVTSSESGQSVLLKPGQQATLTDRLKIEEADIQQQLAWKNGDFIFQGETLDDILRKVARWYDVDVECPEHFGQLRFNGMVSRSKPLSTIIDIIQSTNKVNIKLEGRRLIVRN